MAAKHSRQNFIDWIWSKIRFFSAGIYWREKSDMPEVKFYVSVNDLRLEFTEMNDEENCNCKE